MDINKFDRRYFNKREKQCKEAILYGDYCERKATFYKKLYEMTGWKWAKKQNSYWVNEGIKRLIANMAIIATIDLPVLDKLSKGE